MNEYSERFGTDFSTNKQVLNEISTIRSKGLKNEIAGYITKLLQRQSKFEQRKQMLIENEKKSQERKKSRIKKTETVEEPVAEVEETVAEKSDAEEILDETKQ